MGNILDFYKGKRIFLTGHTGFKGSWMCRILANAGAVVTGYSLEAPTEPSLFQIANIEDDIHSVIGDIRDYASLKKAFDESQPEIVLHLAAQPIVRDSYKDPAYTYETNVMGTVNILECVRNNCCVKSFLNVTTDKVYLNIYAQKRQEKQSSSAAQRGSSSPASHARITVTARSESSCALPGSKGTLSSYTSMVSAFMAVNRVGFSDRFRYAMYNCTCAKYSGYAFSKPCLSSLFQPLEPSRLFPIGPSIARHGYNR